MSRLTEEELKWMLGHDKNTTTYKAARSAEGLCSLLAVIFRDGGQRANRFPSDEAAAKEAEQIVLKLIDKIAELEIENAGLRERFKMWDVAKDAEAELETKNAKLLTSLDVEIHWKEMWKDEATARRDENAKLLAMCRSSLDVIEEILDDGEVNVFKVKNHCLMCRAALKGGGDEN